MTKLTTKRQMLAQNGKFNDKHPHRALERGQFRNIFFAYFCGYFYWYQISRCVRTHLTIKKTTMTKNKLNMEILRK